MDAILCEGVVWIKMDKVNLEGRLVEILRLEQAPEYALRALSSYVGFISAFRRWQFNGKTDYSGISSAISHNPLLCDEVMQLAEVGGGQGVGSDRFFFDLIRQRPDSEIRELYDFFVKTVTEHHEKPDQAMYNLLLNSYVEILGDFDKFANNVGLLKRFVEPHFGRENFLEGRDVARILNDVPEDENRADPQFLFMLKYKGIAKYEVTNLANKIPELDQYRRDLHDELKGYGAKIGKSENEVLADIVLKYNTENYKIEIDTNKKEIIVGQGVLTTTNLLVDTLKVVPEGHYQCLNPEIHNYEDLERAKKLALKILERHLAGESSYQGRYTSKKNGNTEEDDRALFEKIMAENPDIPMAHGFELSHVVHGSTAFMHRLRADVSGLFESGQIETRMAEFVKYLSEQTK